MDLLFSHIEALIFGANEPVSVDEIQSTLNEVFETVIKTENIENVLHTLVEKYEDEQYSFSIAHIGEGYIFLTKVAYQASIAKLLREKTKKKLSNTALETLSIIAYEQPVTKSKLEKIRGVHCDYSVQKLLEKELIEVIGKSDDIGKPLLFATSKKFLEYFGITNISQLPIPKDFTDETNAIGISNEMIDGKID